MASKRIKALSAITPTPAKVIAHDDESGGGTGKCTIADAVAVGVSALGLNADPSYVDIRDDDFAEWQTDASGGASVSYIPNALPISFPSAGVVVPKVGNTPGDQFTMFRPTIGLAIDSVQPIVISYRLTDPLNTVGVPTRSDDQCAYQIGVIGDIGGGPPNAQILFSALWSGSRTFELTVVANGGAAQHYAIGSLPAGNWREIRLTITPSNVTVDVSTQDGAWTNLITQAATIEQTVYVPVVALQIGTGTGNRILPVDWCHFRAKRAADSAGALTDFGLGLATIMSFNTQNPGDVTDSTPARGTSGQPARSDHQHAHGNRGGGTLHAVAVASGAAGFLSGSDKAKLDGLPSSAVPTTRTLTAGTGLTGGGDLSANRSFAVDTSVIATQAYVDQPVTTLDTGTTPATVVGHIGREFELSNAGAITLTVNDLSAAFVSGHVMIILISLTGGGTLTLTAGAGVTLNGTASGGFFTTLRSKDGVNWWAA